MTYKKYLGIGFLLLVPSTIFGVLLFADAYDDPFYTEEERVLRSYFFFGNTGAFILSIILIVKGFKKRNKSKKLQDEKTTQNRIYYEKTESEKKLNQDKEIQELKEKVEALEKDKERKD